MRVLSRTYRRSGVAQPKALLIPHGSNFAGQFGGMSDALPSRKLAQGISTIGITVGSVTFPLYCFALIVSRAQGWTTLRQDPQ